METGSLTPEVKYQIDIPKGPNIFGHERNWATIQIRVDDKWVTFDYFYKYEGRPHLYRQIGCDNDWYDKCVAIIEQHWSEIESLVKEARLKASL